MCLPAHLVFDFGGPIVFVDILAPALQLIVVLVLHDVEELVEGDFLGFEGGLLQIVIEVLDEGLLVLGDGFVLVQFVPLEPAVLLDDEHPFDEIADGRRDALLRQHQAVVDFDGDLVEYFDVVHGRPGQLLEDHEVQRDSQGPHVRQAGVLLLLDDLRRHERHRPRETHVFLVFVDHFGQDRKSVV